MVRVPIGDLRLGPESSGRRGHLEALRAQIAAQAPALTERYRPEIMYWGGGTASILSPEEIETLYAAVADGFPPGGVVEATIESSPESLTLDTYPVVSGYLDVMREFGRLVSDADGLRIVREDIAQVFISMNWREPPTGAATPVELAWGSL